MEEGEKIDNNNLLPPISLRFEENLVCEKLDELYKFYNSKKQPSEYYKGAIFAARQENRSNPDWFAQATHSLREILYPFFSSKIKEIKTDLRKKEAFEKFGAVGAKQLTEEEIGVFYGKLNLSAHHCSTENFEDIRQEFVRIMEKALAHQLDIHKLLDEILSKKSQSTQVKDIEDLTSLNQDAKRYFFAQADESWIDWLWGNGLLDEIKNKAEDQTQYSYRMPALDYLAKAAVKVPDKVAKILLDDGTATKEENFNPEVISRFIRIIVDFPVEQIKSLIPKIHDQKWVYLMRKFGESGYTFKEIAEKLINGKESESILELAQAILAVKSKAEISDRFGEEPFYVNDLEATGVFEALANIEESYAEEALRIAAGVMAEIVKLKEPDESGIFKYQDSFVLFDADFFTLDLADEHDSSLQKDERDLAALLKKLVQRTIGAKCGDENEAKKLFTIIDSLPTNRSIWRLRLFFLAQCPNVFKQELRDAFFKLFEVDNYYEIEGGAEYEKTLKIGFPYLTDFDRRDYVKKVFEYFAKKADNDPDQNWHKRTGLEILSSICDNLTQDELKKCEEVFGGKCDKNYEPQPSATKPVAGFVSHKSPVNPANYTINQIIENLKTEWTPEKLKDQYKGDDLFNPRGAEGLADALKEDLKKRTDEYLENIDGFFDRKAIHPHYLYSLLRGIEEMLRNKQSLNLLQIDQLLLLFGSICQSGMEKPFDRDDKKSYLADWIEVNKLIADILLYILEIKDGPDQNKTHRQIKITIISYLLKINDPINEHEKAEYGDLYTIAINSVRGRALEAFVAFASNDGEILAEDTKKIFKDALTIDSLAIRFIIGRYLATFYFRDKEFVTDLLPEIFQIDDPAQKDSYLATWEGYLSNTLYDKLFVVLSKYYEYAIAFDPNSYTERKYWKGLDETLAVHLALAFTHLNLNIGDPLFEQFWSKPNTKRQYEFISFIGRSVLTRDQVNDEWLKEHKVSKEKLIKFWDWILGNEKIKDPKIFSGFDFWIRPDKDKEVLDDNLVIERVARTLTKSDGDVDWDYGLLERLPIFAAKNGEKTLEIISSYLLDSKGNLNKNRRTPFLREDRIKEALKTIYTNGDEKTKQKVTDLINILIEKGSSMFWDLKEVIS